MMIDVSVLREMMDFVYCQVYFIFFEILEILCLNRKKIISNMCCFIKNRYKIKIRYKLLKYIILVELLWMTIFIEHVTTGKKCVERLHYHLLLY